MIFSPYYDVPERTLEDFNAGRALAAKRVALDPTQLPEIWPEDLDADGRKKNGRGRKPLAESPRHRKVNGAHQWRCGGCGRWLPTSHYWKSAKHRNGLQCQCIECQTMRTKLRRATDR